MNDSSQVNKIFGPTVASATMRTSTSAPPGNYAVACFIRVIQSTEGYILNQEKETTLNSQTLLIANSGCSTAVERTTRNREIVGYILAGCWAFFFFIYSVMCP